MATPLSETSYQNIGWLQTKEGSLLIEAKTRYRDGPEELSTIIREDGEMFSGRAISQAGICSEVGAVAAAQGRLPIAPQRYIAIATMTHNPQDPPCERCVKVLKELSVGMIAFRIDAQNPHSIFRFVIN